MNQSASIELVSYNLNLLESTRKELKLSYPDIVSQINKPAEISYGAVRNLLSPARRQQLNRKGAFYRPDTEHKIKLIANALNLDFEKDIKIIKIVTPKTKEAA